MNEETVCFCDETQQPHMSQQRSNFNGKLYLSKNSSLRTKDLVKELRLLDYSKYIDTKETLQLKLINKECNQTIIMADNLLSVDHCHSVSETCLTERSEKVNYTTRNNNRLIIFDKIFAEHLWAKLRSFIQTLYNGNELQISPHGFDVCKGEWEFAGVNEAIRFNSYESKSNEKFDVHRDAQYCPSGDTRSLLSIVIYLNDDFHGGETKFYIPKQKDISTKGMSLKDEISAHGGLDEGYQKITIKPLCGSAVIFDQGILHESVELKQSTKRILKADIMVSRKNKFGFQISDKEEEDYFKCLNLFREAQQNELSGNNNIANELYEKCLSIRYSYPTKAMLVNKNKDVQSECAKKVTLEDDSKSINENEQLSDDTDELDIYALDIFPIEIWDKLFNFVNCEVTLKNLVLVFPSLTKIKRRMDELKLMPCLISNKGIFYRFSFSDTFFAYENIEACCRVLAGYSSYLLGHNYKDKTYTVRYNQQNDEVTALPLNHFLNSLFFNEPAYGTVYKVKQQNADQMDAEGDFVKSVERSYMLIKHGKQFQGIDVECQLQCHVDIMDSNRQSIDYWDPTNSVAVNTIDRLGQSLYGDRTTFRSIESTLRDDYVKHLMQNVNQPSALILRSLDKPVTVSKYCFCGMGHTDKKITDACHTGTLNHLVFDFSKNSYEVKKVSKDVYLCRPKTYLANDIFKFIGERKELLHQYDVNITTDTDVSFNHASCQCGPVKFKLTEYVNIQSYPLLNKVHVIFEEFEGKMYAWTCYGGITAL